MKQKRYKCAAKEYRKSSSKTRKNNRDVSKTHSAISDARKALRGFLNKEDRRNALIDDYESSLQVVNIFYCFFVQKNSGSFLNYKLCLAIATCYSKHLALQKRGESALKSQRFVCAISISWMPSPAHVQNLKTYQFQKCYVDEKAFAVHCLKARQLSFLTTIKEQVILVLSGFYSILRFLTKSKLSFSLKLLWIR